MFSTFIWSYFELSSHLNAENIFKLIISRMEIPVEDQEKKTKIAQKLNDSGALKRFEDKIRFGQIIAIDEITNGTKDDSIEYFPFQNVDKNEITALQSIFQFLKKNYFSFTLSCLLDEANTKIDENAENIDLTTIPPPEDQIPQKTEPSYYVEPPKVISKKEFNKCKIIMSVDEL
ncbi:hypothetical protein TRFO_11899 [Tritrichomonas foetus]|uniref:Uncharacterized protein n=1 Tax=Tritrichomonas foetus TaxID=1144522 RepID=A0A1J4J7S6_9EUKA|nr:hypothetical protein TRFO_11899 [Tritrichomonas foetus]|eukprot:OHS93284.1 hypothetical protein TRFO_11899 [Tritrichomonas foetus]